MPYFRSLMDAQCVAFHWSASCIGEQNAFMVFMVSLLDKVPQTELYPYTNASVTH